MKIWQKRCCLLLALTMILTMVPPLKMTVLASEELASTDGASESLSIWDGTIGTGFHSGAGTPSDPYVISNGEELAYLSYDISQGNGLKYSGSYFVLSHDIYLNDVSSSDWYEKGSCNQWIPIGSFKQWSTMFYGYPSDQKYEFTGNFDGSGHKIYGLFISGEEDCCGLFGSAEGAQISNLKIVNAYITGNDCVGSIVANSHWGNQIINCESNAIINGNDHVGGIAGRDRSGTYQYNCFKGTLTGGNNTGGIVGNLYTGEALIECCYNSGDITGITNVGGIAGSVNNNDTSTSNVKNCYNEGAIRATGENVYLGGIAGHLGANRSMSYCYNIGMVSADYDTGRIGGLIGNREVRTGFSNCYYLDTTADIDADGFYSPNSENRKSENDLKTICVSWAEQYPSIWYTSGNSLGYDYAKLLFPDTIKYAKLLVCDANTGQEITDYEIEFDESSGLAFVPVPEIDVGNFIAAREDVFQKEINILIKKNGYEPFSCKSSDLNRVPNRSSATSNIILMIPEKTSVDGEQQIKNAFIAEHVEFAKNRHNTIVSTKGFQNAYWRFDDGDEFIASTLGNWLGNVENVLSGKFNGISFSWSYYDMYLADILLSITNQEAEDGLNDTAFSSYNYLISQISGNWVAKFKYLNQYKESLLSASDLEKWNALTQEIDWSHLGLQLEEFIANQEYELDTATRNFLLFVTGEQFFYKYQDTLTEVFEGLNIASEVAKCISSAVDTVDGFRKASQGYVAARTAQNVYEEFFTVLDKTVDEVKKDDLYKGMMLEAALEKYKRAANSDAVLFMEEVNALISGVKDFSYNVFVKSYIVKAGYTLIGEVLNLPAGTIKAVALAYNLGYSIGDAITGVSDKSENYTLMYYVAPVEKALETVSGEYRKELLETYETSGSLGNSSTISSTLYKDAQNYDCAYRILRVTNEYLYSCIYRIGSSGLALDIGGLHIGQAPELVNFSAGFMHFWKQNLCHGNTTIIYNRYKITSIQCPVDVYIYSDTDDLLVSIVNEKVEKSTPEIEILLNNGKKTLVYPADNTYKIKIIAREAGVMDYYVSEIDSQEVRSIEYYGLPLTEGQEYSGTVVSQFEAPKEVYALSTETETALPDFDSNEAGNCLDTPTGLAWEGTSACWNQVSGAIGYKVFIYKDTHPLIELTVSNNKLDLAEYFKENGEYSFAVVAVGPETKNNSRRSEVSRVYSFSNSTPPAVDHTGETAGNHTNYTLTFNTNGGSSIAQVTKSANTTVDLTSYTPTRAGYTFAGWYSDTSLTQKVTSVKLTGNITVYAKWEETVAPTPDFPFTDVSSSDYYYEAVVWAVENAVTTGDTPTTFAPNAGCTRGQIVTFLWRAAGSPAPKTTENPFTDVSSSDYYYEAVLWAVEQEITNGTSPTTFSPNDTCTRAHAVTFLYRNAGSPAASGSSPFTDVPTGEYYYTPVLWAVANGVTTGDTPTTFAPNSTCTRAQIVTFLYRDLA